MLITEMSFKTWVLNLRRGLEGFEHPCVDLPTMFVSLATHGAYSCWETEPAEYDEAVKRIYDWCNEKQCAEVRQLVEHIVSENETNRTERFPKTRETKFAPQEYAPDAKWGAAMIALAKYFGITLPTLSK